MLGSGLGGPVHALEAYDDGGGPVLYAAGEFTEVAGVPTGRIARWNGAEWSTLESGLDAIALALAAYDDGSGSQLYAAGSFHLAGNVVVNHIARWNGSTWSALGPAPNNEVLALVVFDDGTGDALYAGGIFTSAGGALAARVARWDGSAWSALGSGLGGTARAFAVHDDGSGPALFVGGDFTTAGGLPASRVARWDGSSWLPLGVGVEVPGLRGVFVLKAFDLGDGPSLLVGGDFSSPTSGDSYLARWGCDTTPPELACSPVLAADGFTDGMGSEVVTSSALATDDADDFPTVDYVPPSGSVSSLGTTTVTATATDAAGNESMCQFPVTVVRKVRRP